VIGRTGSAERGLWQAGSATFDCRRASRVGRPTRPEFLPDRPLSPGATGSLQLAVCRSTPIDAAARLEGAVAFLLALKAQFHPRIAWRRGPVCSSLRSASRPPARAGA